MPGMISVVGKATSVMDTASYMAKLGETMSTVDKND